MVYGLLTKGQALMWMATRHKRRGYVARARGKFSRLGAVTSDSKNNHWIAEREGIGTGCFPICRHSAKKGKSVAHREV